MKKTTKPIFEPGLSSLIWPMKPEKFLEDYWQKKPLFIRGDQDRLANLRNLFLNFDLNWILRHANLKETMVQTPPSNDRKIQKNAPLDIGAFTQLYRAGCQLYIACSGIPGVKRWIEELSTNLGKFSVTGRGDVYATHKGGGVDSHFDKNDNFTIQLAGSKRWVYLEKPFCTHPTDNSEAFPTMYAPEKEKLPSVTSPGMKSVVLKPGDFFYIPRGFIHGTNAQEESLSFDMNLFGSPWVDAILDPLRSYLIQFEPWRRTAMLDPQAANERIQHLEEAIRMLTVGNLFLTAGEDAPKISRSSKLKLNPFVTWKKSSQQNADDAKIILDFQLPSGYVKPVLFSRQFMAILVRLSKIQAFSTFSASDILKEWKHGENSAMTFLELLAKTGYLIHQAKN